jgi:hypothetical protein
MPSLTRMMLRQSATAEDMGRCDPLLWHSRAGLLACPSPCRTRPGGQASIMSSRTREAASLDVTVAGEDLSLNVRTNLGATVSGRVLIDGQPAGTAANATIPTVVGARQPPRLGGYSYAEPQVTNLRDTDRFELTGLRGPTVLTAQRGRSLVVSMRRAGEDIIGTTLELLGTETIDDIVIEFTTKSAEAEVTIIGTSPLEEPEPIRVVLFAEDPALRNVMPVANTSAVPAGVMFSRRRIS